MFIPTDTVSIAHPTAEEYAGLSLEELDARISVARAKLGSRLVILGHHYQRDDVVKHADLTGDSYGLSVDARKTDAAYIVFCGVHFMAESADILGRADQTVILPDHTAGCSMADMADIEQLEDVWDELAGILGDVEREVMPITYVNSSAAVKAFVGEHGGACCTSSNAEGVVRWAKAQRPKMLFLPDQHLGRYVAHEKLGIPLDKMLVWNPNKRYGGHTPEAIREAEVLLWAGHCSVHAQFRPAHIAAWREQHPDIKVIVHPECALGVAKAADYVGSTAYIIKTINEAPAGTKWAVGTEINLVNRIATANPDKMIVSVSPFACLCSTMYRIDPEELCWVLENLAEGRVVNQIQVPEPQASQARLALERMLEI
ncbi:MAG TPA: quinolinate synthase NadA, partial [Herpetosiphonaceae bacterium]